MADITITHTAAQGTLVEGDPRPHHGILKEAGFRYSRNVGWYVRGSRDRRPDTARIERAATGLREAGFTVEIEIDSSARPAAEREADRAERSEARAEALAAKAGRLHEQSDKIDRDIHEKILDQIPFGQPILVGHHSEKRHRRDLEKAERGMRKSIELYRDAKETERRSDAATANQNRRMSAPTTLRRIEKLEAEARKIERDYLTPCKLSGRQLKDPAATSFTCPACWHDIPVKDGAIAAHGAVTGDAAKAKRRQIDEINDEVAYWRQHLADLEAQGVKLWSPADFKPGDLVEYWGRTGEVVRVNKKSLSVKTQYSWTDKVTYDDVRGKVER